MPATSWESCLQNHTGVSAVGILSKIQMSEDMPNPSGYEERLILFWAVFRGERNQCQARYDRTEAVSYRCTSIFRTEEMVSLRSLVTASTL